MKTYKCDDGNAESEIEAESAEAAAQEYVDGGDWGDGSPCTKTFWIDVQVWKEEEEEEETVKITVDPEEDCIDCIDGNGHDWQSPHALVGGIKENPGVQGHGGGVTCTYACTKCGAQMVTDSWAQHWGQQGLHSVEYTEGVYDVD